MGSTPDGTGETRPWRLQSFMGAPAPKGKRVEKPLWVSFLADLGWVWVWQHATEFPRAIKKKGALVTTGTQHKWKIAVGEPL